MGFHRAKKEETIYIERESSRGQLKIDAGDEEKRSDFEICFFSFFHLLS